MLPSLGIYISVPFCKAKCTFCNFASDVFSEDRMQRYIDRVCSEIAASRARAAALGADLPATIDTLYFGGGTPSLLPAELFRQIFTRLRSEFSFASEAEITLECAPGQLADATLDELVLQGLNRVSLGVQSFNDRESAAAGRLHTRKICLEEIAHLRAVGITDINLDLIAGLPHQTPASWVESLETAIATNAPHLSIYMLEVDDESRLGRELLSKGVRYSAPSVPSDDDTADWYQAACHRLATVGIDQYEISNFSRPGHQSAHNLKYWRRDPYFGFGLDAHSMLPTFEGAVRFANTSDFDLYSAESAAPKVSPTLPLYPRSVASKALPSSEIERITTTQAFEESLFLGLRLNEGVSLSALRDRFGEAFLNQTLNAIQETVEAGLLTLTPDHIALTDRGRMASNEVFSRFLLAPNLQQEVFTAA